MYEELVKELRHYFEGVPLVEQAADAIEDLHRKLMVAEDESGLYDALPIVVQPWHGVCMTPAQEIRFLKLRKAVAEEIERQLEIDPSCKSYEGTWELLLSYPNYFEDHDATADADFCEITLHCYVIGSGRHYKWHGNTVEKALDACEKDVFEWCKNVDETELLS